MTTSTNSNFFANLRIRTKIILLTLTFGLVPALALISILLTHSGQFHKKLSADLAVSARKAVEVIDRNLFERYGDVQAFGLNSAASDPTNWRKGGEMNPLIRAMNGYTTGYGIYSLMGTSKNSPAPSFNRVESR